MEQKELRLLDTINDINLFCHQQAWMWKNDFIPKRLKNFNQESWDRIISRTKDLYDGSFKYTTKQIFAYLVDEPAHLTEEDYFILDCLFHDSMYPNYPKLTILQKEFLKEMDSDIGNAANVISNYIKNSSASWFHFFCKLFFSLPLSYFAMRWKGPAFNPGETFPPAWIDEELNRPYKLMEQCLTQSDAEKLRRSNSVYGDDLRKRLDK